MPRIPKNPITPCSACVPGTYANDTGLLVCPTCVAGSAQMLSGQSQCEPCGLGHFTDRSRTEVCQPCGPGTYTNVSGTIKCAQCGAAFTKGEWIALKGGQAMHDKCVAQDTASERPSDTAYPRRSNRAFSLMK